MEECVVPFAVNGQRYLAVETRASMESGPLCLVVAGSGALDVDGTVGPNRFLLQIAAGLAARGISSVRFAKRRLDRGSEWFDSYESEYVVPFRGLLRVLGRRHGQLPPTVLLGHSLGGHLAPSLAREVGGLRGIVVLNAHVDGLCRILLWQLRRAEASRAARWQGVAAAVGRALEATTADLLDGPLERYFFQARHYSAARAVQALTQPVLGIFGGRDSQIPEDQPAAWRTALVRAGCPFRIRVFPELNHLCMRAATRSALDLTLPGKVDEEVLDEISTWIHQFTG